jgi:hypothetical protein
MMANAACGTIVSKSYLSFARVLARSFQQVHPDVPFFVLLADRIDGCFDPAREPFQLIEFDELEIPDRERFRFVHAPQPLSYACTPYFLACLLARGFRRVVFLKQESLVLGDLTPVFRALDTASIVLTPHLETPLEGPDRVARELNILQSGTFNVGLLAVSAADEAKRFLAWWQDRVRGHCRLDVAGGLHYEQRWLDLVPSLFEGVRILRDRTVNVGHWNLPERAVAVRGDVVTVDGEPCRLFRFSGYDPDQPRSMTKYSTRLTFENVGDARFVFERFGAELEREGYHQTRHWPYAFGFFDNGIAVPELARLLYAAHADGWDGWDDPLRTGPGSFFEWLNAPAAGFPDRPPTVSRLWHAVYSARSDLQAACPDLQSTDRERFLRWAEEFGVDEYRIPRDFVALSGRGR